MGSPGTQEATSHGLEPCRSMNPECPSSDASKGQRSQIGVRGGGPSRPQGPMGHTQSLSRPPQGRLQAPLQRAVLPGQDCPAPAATGPVCGCHARGAPGQECCSTSHSTQDRPRTARWASVPPYWGKNERSAARGTVTHGAPRSCHRGPRALPLPLREEMGAGWGPTCCPRPLASTWHAGTQGMKCAAPEAPPDAEERPEVRRAGHCPRLYELGRCQHLAPHGCRPPAQPASRPQGRTLTDNCCLKREWEQLDPRGRAHSQEVATE